MTCAAGQRYRRPGLDRDRCRVGGVGRERAPDQLAQVGGGVRLERQVVRPHQAPQPAEEGVAVVLAGAALGLGLARQRLHQGEQVLDPVPELAEQQLVLLLLAAALGDVLDREQERGAVAGRGGTSCGR